MLNIYYAGESVDKEKFIFDNITKNKGGTLLIVPDQFSAQTERNAFFYLGTDACMDLRILHFERLGFKALRELARPVPPLIDKYGRHMLLTNIMRNEEKKNNLSTYKAMSEKNTFVSLLNSLISEMKRNEITAEHLEEAISELDDNTYLKRKLMDIKYIFSQYEQAISGKYLDTEDYIDFYGDAIMDAPAVKGAQVWIYGFDTFTPKNIQVIMRILEAAQCVNIVMNYEDKEHTSGMCDAAFLADDAAEGLFALTGYYISKIRSGAEDTGHNVKVQRIAAYQRQSVWSKLIKDGMNNPEAEGNEGTYECIKLVLSQSPYEEAEAAASYVLELVRDKGYRYRDIVIICNDMKGLGSILKRVFDRWQIPVFMDRKRKVLHHPAVSFVISLMDIAVSAGGTESVMRMIKTGLMDFDADDAELLENYAYAYKIRGRKWHEEFTRTDRSFSQEDLERLNALREVVSKTMEGAASCMGKRNTAGDKIKGLYEFLTVNFEIEQRLEKIMDRQQEAGFNDAALETAQSWNVICEIFSQIVEIMGDKKISGTELKKLLISGLEEIQIGIVPSDTDSVTLASLQRTRLSRNKVLMVVGANEGYLPLQESSEGILSEAEIEKLDSMNVTLRKTEDMARGEEMLAIYRNFTAPQDRLYVSCSKTSTEAGVQKPSRVFEKLADFAKVDEASQERGSIIHFVTNPSGTLPHVAEAMRKYRDTEEINEQWKQVINWYVSHERDDFAKVRKGLEFTNRLEKLGGEFAQALYIGDEKSLEVSASRLEKYSACPFAHFMDYGLAAEELIKYEIGDRETGDIYHECLMRFSQRMAGDRRRAINDPDSLWMKTDDDGCRRIIEDIMRNEMPAYKGGLINFGAEETYRTARIIDVCSNVAASLVRQVQKGHIRSMDFEKRFGRGSDIPPIKVKLGDKVILLRGIIDRLDVLDAGNGQQAVRIIDYKTGNTEIKKEYYESGYKLQLMVYLNAALAKNAGHKLSKDENNADAPLPAGVFHFHIDEMDEADEMGKARKGSKKDRQDMNYRLKGFVLNEDNVIRAMDEEFEENSSVIPVKILKKDGSYASGGGGKLFSRDEFKELCRAVDDNVHRICEEITSGAIDIAPRTDGRSSACRYCRYKSVCVFDTSFEGCRYIRV